ncbi:hypothetical protein [Mycobacterium sp. 23]|uniref:hypothetical protein n=1 Tax=Mycobacterium sp. 23 TaxID=3400424 RepID=UPI003AAB9E63
MNDEEFAYDLVMPFIPVQSKGGPYDDDAFVAGYEMGLLDAQLSGSTFTQGHAIRAENQHQADLIAMRHGYVAEFTTTEEAPGWVCMKTRRVAGGTA